MTMQPTDLNELAHASVEQNAARAAKKNKTDDEDEEE